MRHHHAPEYSGDSGQTLDDLRVDTLETGGMVQVPRQIKTREAAETFAYGDLGHSVEHNPSVADTRYDAMCSLIDYIYGKAE